MIQEDKLSKALFSLAGEFQTMDRDPEVFLSRVADLAPELDKERFILRFFLVFDGYKKLTNNAKNEKEYQKNIRQICNEMNHQYGIDKQDIAGVCLAFAAAHGVSLNAKEIYEAVSPRPVVQKTADAPAPSPASAPVPSSSIKPLSAVPVSYETEARYHQGETGRKCGKVLGADCYRTAAEAGHIEASFAYAECCRAGHGAKKDLTEARKWYTVAAQKGHPGAQIALADLYQADQTQAESDRSIVYASERECFANPRLADVLPRFNHMTYGARTGKYAFVYLLLALYAFQNMFFSAVAYNIPSFYLFPLHKEIWAFWVWLSNWASVDVFRLVFWVHIVLSFLIGLGICLCCKLDKKRAMIFRADNPGIAGTLRKFFMILITVLQVIFPLANPVTVNTWKIYGPEFMMPVITFFRNIYHSMGILNNSGIPQGILPVMSYILVLLLLCSVIIAMQARTFRRFNNTLHRYWLLPVQTKRHLFVRVPVLMALVIFALLGLWMGQNLVLPIAILVALLPKRFYY